MQGQIEVINFLNSLLVGELGAQADHIAGIGRDCGLVQDDIKHGRCAGQGATA